MADIVVSVASKVAEYLVAPVGRQCGYVIFSYSRVRQLEDEVKKLDRARQRVQHSIDDAGSKPIEADVNDWVDEEKAIAKKAHGVLDDDIRAKKTCFYGWLPNPKARYRLGKEASTTVKDIRELIARSKFEKVPFENSPPGLVGGAPDENSSASDGGNTITDSRASIFQGIMEALDDEKLKVIGVYGPGGVGKTTLLEEVEKKLRKERRPFHMIVKAKVSQTPDLKKIQDDIAYALSLNSLKDEPSEEGRRDLLFKRLQKDPSEKVLIILDDLWAELDLKAVGIPLGAESMKCKLLLTSRDKSVLEQRMHAEPTFHLEGLKEDEAFRLFEKTVGNKLQDDEQLKAKAAQVVRKLAGLPLLITSVASTLKFSEMSTWDNALIKIEDPKIEKIVKLSYDHLESKDAKSLFLLCGLIGGSIQVELLLGLGMGLGLFEGFNKTIQSSRDKLNDMLRSLRSKCLLLDGGNDKENVTIHDLYSEAVISNAFSGQHSLIFNSNYGSWSKDKLEKCWAICLVNVGNDRLAQLMQWGFPDLKILMLSEQHRIADCSRMDFTYMKGLGALCLRSMLIPSLPSSIGILKNLHSLYLDCCSVEDVAILGKLEELRILSFAGSRISRLPKQIGELTTLQSLNLSNCYWLKIIEPGALKGLINLEELHMKGISVQWMGKHEIPLESCGAGLAELKNLTKLASLEISIRHPIIPLEDGDLPFGNLTRFWINIGNVGNREFEGLTTMKLKLEGCNDILSREWVQKALQKTQYLYLCKLSEFKESAHKLCTQRFQELKHLHIDDSPSIKYIANSSDAFMKLESLRLENLINLEKIYHGPTAPVCFSKLKAVSVIRCNQLKYLWRLSDMQRFVQLEEIEVQECDSLQSIVAHDAGEEIVFADNGVELPKVRRLVLHQLPNMTSFCIRAEITSEHTPIQVPFPRLESLVMVGLLDLEKILYGQPPLEYNNLKSIEIRESRSKSSFFKSDCILKLPNLESMNIMNSLSAEAVFDLGELKVTRDVEILSRLMELTIRESPNLRCMWKQDVKLQGISVFRSLTKLKVIKTGLAFLFPVSVAKCLREIRDIKVENCPNMKAVIVDEEGRDEWTEDVIEFPLLEGLRICNCPMEKFFSYPHGNKEPVTATSDSQDAYSDSFFDQKVSLPSLEELELESIGSFKWIWHSELPRSSFCELASLTLENCSELLNVFPSTIIGRLHNLQSVDIKNCPSLESLFDCGSLDANTEQTTVLLHKLEELTVREAGKLRSLVKGGSQTILGFPRLRFIKVDKCSDMKYLFPHFTSTTLEKLERINISQCEQMKEVVLVQEGGRSKEEVMRFPSLEYLSISQCRNFGAFIHSPTSVKRQLNKMAEKNDESPQSLFNEMVTFPNIRELEIEDVQCKELWNNQIPTDSFGKLKSLELKKCDNLRRIAPSHMWKRLQCCLKILQVSSCRSIEIVYEGGGTDIESGKLRRLVLRDLENLRHIWRSDGLSNVPFPNLTEVVPEEEGCRSKEEVMRFPSLEYLSISQCRNFGAFIRSPTSVKRQLDEMAEKNDESPQLLFNEMVTFPNIRKLVIEGLQCKELWNNQIPTDSFGKLKSLELKKCDNLRRIGPSHMWKRLQRCLKILQVSSCRSIEIVYEGGETDTENSKLRRLVLRDLENLRHIWRSDGLPNIPFLNLRDVEAVRCSRLEMLFATFTAKFLGHIKELVVESCENMELIADHEKRGGATCTRITFSDLTALRLFELPKFRGFLPEEYSLKFPYSEDFPSLRDLSVVSCGAEPDRGNVDWESRRRRRRLLRLLRWPFKRLE